MKEAVFEFDKYTVGVDIGHNDQTTIVFISKKGDTMIIDSIISGESAKIVLDMFKKRQHVKDIIELMKKEINPEIKDWATDLEEAL